MMGTHMCVCAEEMGLGQEGRRKILALVLVCYRVLDFLWIHLIYFYCFLQTLIINWNLPLPVSSAHAWHP